MPFEQKHGNGKSEANEHGPGETASGRHGATTIPTMPTVKPPATVGQRGPLAPPAGYSPGHRGGPTQPSTTTINPAQTNPGPVGDPAPAVPALPAQHGGDAASASRVKRSGGVPRT